MRSLCFALVVAWLGGVGVDGFLYPSPMSRTVTPTKSQHHRVGEKTSPHPLYSDTSTGWDSFENKSRTMTNIPSGEEQRKLRRTVYSHDDWKKHRSQDRFIYYLAAIFKSGVYKNLGREVALTTSVAVFVCVYNLLVGGYTDFAGVQHASVLGDFLPKLGIPLSAFTLTSPSLGLLLGTYA